MTFDEFPPELPTKHFETEVDGSLRIVIGPEPVVSSAERRVTRQRREHGVYSEGEHAYLYRSGETWVVGDANEHPLGRWQPTYVDAIRYWGVA